MKYKYVYNIHFLKIQILLICIQEAYHRELISFNVWKAIFDKGEARK